MIVIMFKNIIGKIVTSLPRPLSEKVGRKLLKLIIVNKANMIISGMENLQKIKGPKIFICNHLSNADGILLNDVLKEFDPTFVAGVKLNANNFTKIGMIAVKQTPIKPDSADKAGLTKIINILKNGESVTIFPEGTRSRNGKMIKAKKGLYLIAKISKATIIPIGIFGTEKLMPINDKGMHKEKIIRSDVYINFGKPFKIRAKEKDEDKKLYEESVTDECMYKIAELLPEHYRGEYNF